MNHHGRRIHESKSKGRVRWDEMHPEHIKRAAALERKRERGDHALADDMDAYATHREAQEKARAERDAED